MVSKLLRVSPVSAAGAWTLCTVAREKSSIPANSLALKQPALLRGGLSEPGDPPPASGQVA